MPPAAEVPSTTTSASPGRAVQRHHHAGRRLVVRVRVDVAVDVRRGSRAPRRARSRSTCGSSRCGAARRDRRELRRELADHEVRAAPLDRARTRPRPRTASSRRCRAAPRSRRGARRARRGPRGCGAPPSAHRRGGGSCRGSRARRRRARRPLRRAPSTGRSRSVRRAGAARAGAIDVGRAGARCSPLHDNGCPDRPVQFDRRLRSSVASSWRASRRSRGAGSRRARPRRARRSCRSTTPMQHVSQCEISETLTAAPAVGANAYRRSTRAPPVNTGTGAPGTFVATKSQHFSMPPNSAVVVAVGSRFSMPASALVICSAGSARQLRTSTPTAPHALGRIVDVGRHREARRREAIAAARRRRPCAG